jgi:DNA-binding response OmpR family regulator
LGEFSLLAIHLNSDQTDEEMRMLNILLVDDDSCLTFILSENLQASGHRCVSAENVEQARFHLRQAAYDLVISDVNMPGESGFDLLNYVTSRHPDTAFLLMSAMDDPRDRRRALQMGATGYLGKPFRIAELNTRINAVAEHSHKNNEEAGLPLHFDRSGFVLHKRADCSPLSLQTL